MWTCAMINLTYQLNLDHFTLYNLFALFRNIKMHLHTFCDSNFLLKNKSFILKHKTSHCQPVFLSLSKIDKDKILTWPTISTHSTKSKKSTHVLVGLLGLLSVGCTPIRIITECHQRNGMKFPSINHSSIFIIFLFFNIKL